MLYSPEVIERSQLRPHFDHLALPAPHATAGVVRVRGDDGGGPEEGLGPVGERGVGPGQAPVGAHVAPGTNVAPGRARNETEV